MVQTCGVCRTSVTAVVFAAFCFGFWQLGLWPFMLFLGATCALSVLDWTSFQDRVTFLGLIFFALMTGSMASLLYFVYIFFPISPEIAAYPFLSVGVYDGAKFLMQSLLSRSSQQYQVSFDKRLVGIIFGIGALSVFNWYVLQRWNPLAFFNFPTNYYALFGFSVLCAICMMVGKLLMNQSIGGDHDHKDGCPPVSSVCFSKFFGSYIFFAYLLMFISFGRHLVHLSF